MDCIGQDGLGHIQRLEDSRNDNGSTLIEF